jgi:hypothetical protein
MYRKLGATGVFLTTTLWAQHALAFCFFGFGDCGGGGGGGGGGGAVPEIDGTGALAVFAILGAIVAMLYGRAHR